jgi:uncharacterized protein YchJ
MTTITPSALILARAAALRRADYGYIFDSYHSASMFRQQFQQREDYVRFGWACLGKDFRILHCRIIAEEISGPEARVIFYMEIEVHGEAKAYAELAWMFREGGAWRYHRGQKIEESELPCPPGQLDFETFERVEQKVIF